MTEPQSILLVGLILGGLGAMIAWGVSKHPLLSFTSAGLWLLAGIFSYTLSTGGWDIYYGLFWLCMGLLIATALGAGLQENERRKKARSEPVSVNENHVRIVGKAPEYKRFDEPRTQQREVSEWGDDDEDPMEEYRRERERMNRAHVIQPSELRRRIRERKMAKWDRMPQ